MLKDIDITGPPFIPIGKYFEKLKKKQEACDHNCEPRIGYFIHHEIQRTGMYCTKCNLLMDYMPQYMRDDL